MKQELRKTLSFVVLAFFAGSLAFAGSFQETVQKALEKGNVGTAHSAAASASSSTATSTAKVPASSTGFVNPDNLTSNPEVDPKGEYAPSKVVNLSADQLQKLILAKFNVRLLGGLIGKGAEKDGYLWTQKQMWEVYRTLYSLPKIFFCRTLEIKREKVAFNNPYILGYVWSGIPRVHLADSSVRAGLFNEVLAHEMAHCWEFTYSNLSLQKKWKETFWTDGGTTYKTKPPTTYGGTNYHEDFAESVKTYWANGANLKSTNPARYEFVKNYVMNGREFRR